MSGLFTQCLLNEFILSVFCKAWQAKNLNKLHLHLGLRKVCVKKGKNTKYKTSLTYFWVRSIASFSM